MEEITVRVSERLAERLQRIGRERNMAVSEVDSQLQQRETARQRRGAPTAAGGARFRHQGACGSPRPDGHGGGARGGPRMSDPFGDRAAKCLDQAGAIAHD